MIQLMQQKEKAASKRRGKAKQKKEEWFLYILRCFDGSLYTGITKNLEKRFKMHNAGRASRYTRTRRPVELLYQEVCRSRTQALVRECIIKSLPKDKKEDLVQNRT